MDINSIQVQVTPLAAQSIEALRHKAGTLEVYRTTLTRLYNSVLYFAEDFGMDEVEALNTLRAIDMLRTDLTAIAEIPDSDADDPDIGEQEAPIPDDIEKESLSVHNEQVKS